MNQFPNKNYFTMPNEIFSLGLDASEIAVYAYLRCLENRSTYQCWPSYTMIGNAVGRAKNTVMRYVDALAEKGLIYTEPTSVLTKSRIKKNGNLRYTIRPIHEAVEIFHTRQLSAVERTTERRQIHRKLSAVNTHNICWESCTSRGKVFNKTPMLPTSGPQRRTTADIPTRECSWIELSAASSVRLLLCWRPRACSTTWAISSETTPRLPLPTASKSTASGWRGCGKSASPSAASRTIMSWNSSRDIRCSFVDPANAKGNTNHVYALY